MRTILMLALVALAGCGTETAYDRTNRACRFAENVPAWNRCVEEVTATMARERAEEASRPVTRERSTDSDDAAGLLLLGGAAFLGGYNSSRPTITCTSIGGITTCR